MGFLTIVSFWPVMDDFYPRSLGYPAPGSWYPVSVRCGFPLLTWV